MPTILTAFTLVHNCGTAYTLVDNCDIAYTLTCEVYLSSDICQMCWADKSAYRSQRVNLIVA